MSDSFFLDDPDDKLDAKPEVTEPEDMILAPKNEPIKISADGSLPAPTVPPPLARFTDEDLFAEILKRRQSRLDDEIATAQAIVDNLKAQRAALYGESIPSSSSALVGTTAAEVLPARPIIREQTLVNPVTGKIKKSKPIPGSVSPANCDCEGGCYLCTKY